VAGPTPKVARPANPEPEADGDGEAEPDGEATAGVARASNMASNSPIPQAIPRRWDGLAVGRQRRNDDLAGMSVRTLTSGVGKVNWA